MINICVFLKVSDPHASYLLLFVDSLNPHERFVFEFSGYFLLDVIIISRFPNCHSGPVGQLVPSHRGSEHDLLDVFSVLFII